MIKQESEMKTLEDNKVLTTVELASYECTVTVDCAVFGFQDGELKLLLVKRSLEPFKDYWLLPGGIMDKGQSLNDAAEFVLLNLTGLRKIHIEQVRCYGGLNRHPIKRVVTVCFYALIKPEDHQIIPKSYISEVRWFNIRKIPSLGFDHNQLVADALKKLQRDMEGEFIFDELLAEKFTLNELQKLYEAILGESLDRRNFRKKILQKEFLVKTEEKKVGAKGGPTLYIFRKR